MQQIAGRGGRSSKPLCLALPGTYELPHSAFSPTLLYAKHPVCQYDQDGAEKVGSPMQ